MLNQSFEAGILPPSLRYGLITLACKDVDHAQLLANWRPISLLNIDYKILAKFLAKRLSSVLSHSGGVSNLKVEGTWRARSSSL